MYQMSLKLTYKNTKGVICIRNNITETLKITRKNKMKKRTSHYL